MKHRIYTLIAIAIYIIMIVAGLVIYIPAGNLELNVIARDSDGNIYGVSSDKFFMNIYKMDSEGNPLDLYRCKSESSEVESFCRYNNNTMYVGQIWYEEGLQAFSVWKKGEDDKSFTQVWKNVMEEEIQITDFYVKDGEMYVLGIEWSTKNIIVYCKNNNDNILVYRFSMNFFPVNANWGNNGVYALSQDNHVYYLDLEGNKSELAVEDAVILMTDEDGYYYQCINSEELKYVLYNGLGEYTYSDLGDIWFILRSDRAQNSALLSFIDGKDKLMIVEQDGTVKYIDDFKLGFMKMLGKCLIPLLVANIIYISLALVVYIFKKLVWNKKRLRYQTISFVAVTSFVWLAVMLVIIKYNENNNEREDRDSYVYTCESIQSGRVQSESGILGLDYENYRGSTQQEKIEQIFGYDLMGSTWQFYFTSQEIIYGADNPVFVFSDSAAYGRSVDTFYDANTVEKIEECIRTGEEQSFTDYLSEREYVIRIVPIGNDSQQLCLLVRIPLDVGEKTHNSFKYLYAVSSVGWLILILCLGLFLRRKWNFMETMVVRMDRVSRGDYKIEERKVPDNEFGNMWTSLVRMCKNIQMQRYKQIGTLDYVNQFAPKNFERLFGKERLQDIEVGETRQISATMGLISVIDMDTLLTGQLQRKYVQYVNQLMEILFSQSESDQAIFIQNGSNLESVKVIFKEDNDSTITAARYSIDCIETLLGLTKTQYDTKPFILLHTSTFTCGVAGGSMQVYPFVTSIEMETLGTYVVPLKNCGVRMVVTQSTWQEVGEKVKSRYIGYVNSKDGRESYKLYEVLDACSQPQELGKIKNIENFDKALQCYYANDLYVARNMFSDIVKECPDDGIARWYVFACDELFNREDISDAHYELFWSMF